MPRGYGIGLVGIVLATVGGIGDFIWHAIFGFEDQVNAFWSPPHQMLFLGGTLVVVAPLVSTWYRHDGPLDRRGAVPVVGSLALIMGTATYALTHLSPLWNNLSLTPAYQRDLARFDDAYPSGALEAGPRRASTSRCARSATTRSRTTSTPSTTPSPGSSCSRSP